MKEVVLKTVKKALKSLKISIPDQQLSNSITIPPSSEMGDYSLPCFFLASLMRDDPHEIALRIREAIGEPAATDFEDVQVTGPYVNFVLNRKSIAKEVVWNAITFKKKYGQGSAGKGKKTMVEFPSPNTNKPLHLGHLRNMAIGESISRILEFNGEKVIRANLNNDRGIHISKSMLAYQKWGKNATPEKKKIKPDHFVGNFYVMFEKKKNKKLEWAAQEMLQKWEEGDKKTLYLWKLMTDWALEGFAETYETFGVKHDVTFDESKIYKRGKDMVLDGVKKKLFEKTTNGEVKINLSAEGLGEKVLLRSDGTAIYIVQDLALAKEKFENYKIDRSLYVVASEQEYHFKVLFTVLEKLGFKSKDMRHVSYGLVNLPHGRMKSREGTVVDADDLIAQVAALASKELKKRDKALKTSELEKRSLAIALAAIKYMLLKIDLKKTMLFNPKESIDFEGDTGPYLMYSYARASSILRKSPGQLKKFDVTQLSKEEIELVKKLSQFPEAVTSAYKSLNPATIANYATQLAQRFNEFYHACPVIGSAEETFRLALVESFRQTLKNALWLLGLDTLEEM